MEPVKSNIGPPQIDFDEWFTDRTAPAMSQNADALPAKNGSAPNLNQAIRRARIEAAEHGQGFGDMRSAEIARLEILHDQLQPVLAQLPRGNDLFDTGIVPGEQPRLFIDMVAFVQMARDKRTYEFLQDRRDARVKLAESADAATMADAITAYIAKRLVQRERALASLDDTPVIWPKPDTRAAAQPADQSWKSEAAPAELPKPVAEVAPAPLRQHRPHHHGWFLRTLLFIIEFLGVAALLALLIAAGFFLYMRLSGVN